MVYQTTFDFNTLRPRRNGRYFPDNTFNCIFLNGNIWILTEMSLTFVPKGPINDIPELVQTDLAPSRRQVIVWTNDGKFTDAYMRQSASMS